MISPNKSTGSAKSDSAMLSEVISKIRNGAVPNLSSLLPAILNLDGKPYGLDKHYQFESLFNFHMPRRTILKTGRQVGKSTVISAHGVIICATVPYFRNLYITPLFEQVRRLSSNYVRPFIEQSPIKSILIGPETENSVLQRSFRNNSMMQFSFALLDADRIRGIRADQVIIDEVQDMDSDHIPVIRETMSASEWGTMKIAGTPKTLDNTIEREWLSSSQAEWCIVCRACKYLNVSSTFNDLMKMIGPPRSDISGDNPGTVCAKCSRVIYPKDGRWIHKHPERRTNYAGYHIPQPIMHIHYSRPDKWAELNAKKEGMGNYTHEKFLNEVLGESSGAGLQLVSLPELQAASNPDLKNNPRDPSLNCKDDIIKKYRHRVLSVDWGGGGAKGVSLTVLAVMGITASGVIEVIWAKRLLTPHDHMAEAGECLKIYRMFKCEFIAHDFSGAGVIRETVLVQSGISASNLLPVQYIRASSKGMFTYVPSAPAHPRAHYRADKTRSLLTTCSAIRKGSVRFFAYDYISSEEPGLIQDFLALIESKATTSIGSDIYTIQRNPALSDDFAQAVNIGCLCLWHMTGSWPNFKTQKYSITKEQAQEAGMDGWNA